MIKLKEILNILPKLYHGTCDENAQVLLKTGFTPNTVSSGGNMGQSKYLYVTNDIENARWFANEKGCNDILQIENIPIEYISVDPEDGTEKTVEDELNKKFGLPAYLVITKKLGPEHFKKI